MDYKSSANKTTQLRMFELRKLGTYFDEKSKKYVARNAAQTAINSSKKQQQYPPKQTNNRGRCWEPLGTRNSDKFVLISALPISTAR